MPDQKSNTALIASGIPIIGDIANAISTGAQNRAQRRWNEKMYGIQRRDALADWEMQNAYNSPASQMERLKAAGLNPNLVYGNGATAEGGIVRSTDVKGWNPQAPQFNPGAAMSAYYDTQIRQQQLDNLKTQQTLMEQEVNNKIANELKTYNDAEKSKSSRDLIDTMVQIRGVDLSYAPQTAATSLAAKKAGIEKTIQDTRLSAANTSYRLSENERAAIRLDMGLKEAVTRIAKMRADTLRSQAQMTTEYYKKQQLMDQAIMIEKRIGTEDLNQQIKREEVRLKQATPDTYEKMLLDAAGGIINKLTSPGTRLNPKTFQGWKR